MKRPFKKLTAWLCCMAMLISFIPATALPVFADEAEGEVEWTVIEVTQTEGELPALEANSSYELESDLTLTGDLTVPTYIAVDQVVTLDLAGHNLIAGETADGGIFAVDDAAGHLTITDSLGGGKLISGTSNGTPAVQVQAGEFTLEDGEITGWNRAGAGGMVFVGANGTFNMAGGKLTGASAHYGAAIRCEGGVVNMTAGEISGNTAADRAVIRLAGGSEMTMSGGEIKNNTSTTFAGAIRVCADAEFTMTGGTISGNKATTDGGAIYVEGTATVDGDAVITGNEAGRDGAGVFVAKNGAFTLDDGTISNNTAVNFGGGIGTTNGPCVVTVNGGTITGNNAARGTGICMSEGGDNTLNITGGTITNNGTATASDTYSGISTHTGTYNISGGTMDKVYGRFGTINVTGNPVISRLYFSAANTTATIGQLTDGADVTVYADALTVTDSTVKVEGKKYTYGVATLPASGVVDPGVYELTKNVVLEGELTITDAVTIDLKGYTISGPTGRIFYLSKGTSALTIKDSTATGTPGVDYVSGAIVGGTNATNDNYGMIDVRGGTFTLESGKLTGYTHTGGGNRGGAVGLLSGVTFTMNGGEISGNSTANGGAVLVTTGSKFIMNGGAITGNAASGKGGAVYVEATDSTFTMTDGTISGNTAANGAGVYTQSTAATSVTISGGEISGNTATTNGGGLFVASGSNAVVSGDTVIKGNKSNNGGGVYVDTTGTFTLEDGTLTENEGTTYGGGIGTAYSSTATITVNGGTITGNIGGRGNSIFMGEGAASTLNLNGGTTDYDGTGYGGVYSHTGTINITGGTHPYVYLRATGTMNISGNPVISTYLRTDGPASVPATIGNLTSGAHVFTWTAETLTIAEGDETVYTENNRTYKFVDDVNKVYSVTVGEVANGTVTVDPAEGVAGTTVTVTATPADGYELTAILVNGVAIEGNTFAIAAGENVVTATFAEVVLELPAKGSVAAGEYVLTENLTLTGALTVTDVAVVIDLAGYTITAPAGGGAFGVYGSGELTIKDSVGGGKVVSGVSEGTPAVSIQEGATFNLEGGEITGWTREGGAGGMIFLAANTTFNMKGGKLTGATAGYGAAIRVNAAGATVNMTGGEISGNKATGSYGPIILAADSTFNMTGGTITGNTGVNGGAIGMSGAATVTVGGNAVISNNTASNAGGAVWMWQGATFTMDGGSITGNKTEAGFGGAIYLEAISSNKTGTITVNGGEITGNTAVGCGGAIGLSNTSAGTVTITGGTLTGNTASRGNAIHMGEGQASVLNLAGGTTDYDDTAYGGVYSHTGTINVTGGNHAKVYMRVGTVTISGNPVISKHLRVSDGATATIGSLTTGASVFTWDNATLTIAEGDETVYTEDNRTYKFVGDVEAEPEVYDVIVVNPLGGTVSVDKNNAAEGETITVTATPNEGYELTAILVNGEAIEGTTFTMPAASVQVTATFTAVEPEGLPTSGVVAAGEYVLTENLTATGWLTIRDEVVIDLAGYTITAGAGGNVFLLDKAESKLTLKDSSEGKTGKVVSGASEGNPAVYLQTAGAQFVLDGGEITGWNRAGGAGGMVYLLAGTTFTMNGGKLTGASGAHNSVIRAGAGESTITITGGEISGNSVTVNSPIALASGVTMNITGGTFTGNTAGENGLIHVPAGAELNISGGTFTENTAKNGGVIFNEGTVSITNGTFTDNEATVAGGAIIIRKGSTTSITGGTFTGNTSARGGAIGTGEVVLSEGLPVLTIGGTAVIKDNICTEYGGNLYAYTTTLTIEGGTIGTAFKGEEVASKSASGNIWLRGNDATVTTITGGNINGLTVTNGTTNVSGNPVIGEINANMTMSNLTSGASIRTALDTNVVTVPEGDETVYTTNGRDYYFKGDMGLADKFVPGATVTLTADDTVGGGISLTAAGDYILDLAGHTLTGTAAPYFTIGEGVKLTVIDSSATESGKIVGLTNSTKAMIQVNGGNFSLDGGLLTGHNTTAYGGVILAGTGSVVTLSGGEISGNTAARGGALATTSTNAEANIKVTITGDVVIKDNTATDAGGANLYLYNSVGTDEAATNGNELVISGGTIGAGVLDTAAADPVVAVTSQNTWIRGFNTEISGAPVIDTMYVVDQTTAKVTLTVSGAPKIGELQANGVSTATISNLTTGARIATNTNAPLTIAEGDTTVNYTYRLYRFQGDLTSILFVGNSFAGDTTKFLTQLGDIYGNEIDAAYLYVGSQNIRWHAQSLAESLRETDLNGDGVVGDSRDRVGDGLYTCTGFEGYVDIPTVMEGKTWDYVVLQPGVEYVGFEGTYNSDIDFLMDYVADVQPDAQILWSQTWAVDNRSWSTQTNPDNPEEVVGGEWVNSSSYLTQFGGSQKAMYDAILRNTDKFIAGDDARFDFDGWFPIGIAIQNMRNSYSDSYLTRDGFHLSHNAGRLIAGLTVYKTLFPETALTELTAEQVAAMFAANTENTGAAEHLQDAFVADAANVALLLGAVEAACQYKDSVPEYGDGTANKQFNPDAAIAEGAEYVAVYENVTEVGQVATNERYATTGAGKIVIYEDGMAVATIDELWLEKNAGIVLTDRYTKLTADEEYYIQADPQNPQLAVIGSTLYMTFDVKLYSDVQNTIINGGIYMTTSDDGDTWTKAVKVSDAPMAYGLTALSDGNLIMSVADTTTKAVKISTAGAVVSSFELTSEIAEVAFAEVGDNVFALTSTGALYVSDDLGASWTATSVNNGATASPDMVVVKTGAYVIWADETNMKLYSKVWSVDAEDTTAYGWNRTEATVVTGYTPATAYNGKTAGGQPTVYLASSSSMQYVVKGAYVSEGKLVETEQTLSTLMARSLNLESSLAINYRIPEDSINGLGAAYAKVVRVPANGDAATTTVIPCEDWGNIYYSKMDCYEFSVSFAAKEMGDLVYMAIYDADGKQLTLLDKYSIVTYANKMLANYASATKAKDIANRTLMVDLLNYGAAAQVKFSYATDKLVNAHLSAEQQAWATPELVHDETLTSNGAVSNTNGVQCAKSLALESVIEVNMRFVASTLSATPAYAKATFTPFSGSSEVSYTYELTDEVYSKKDCKKLVLTELAVADFSTKVTVELFDEQDNPIPGTLCVYSMETYSYNTTKNSSDAAMRTLAMRLAQFGRAAYTYLTTK